MQRGTLSIRGLAVLAAALGAVACSSGGSSGGPQTGQFIDSPVQGLRYVGDTYSGITDADGVYAFEPGDEVCFYLGLFELGCSEASGIVTPLDLLPGYQSGDDPTVNMVRLLMSLDADGDPSNGLDVSNVAEGATGAGIDFFASTAGFEGDMDVQDFVAAYGPAGASGDLVDEGDARDHFQDSLEDNDYFERQLVGDWLYTTWEEGTPTESGPFGIALADLEALDAEVYEDGEVMFTRVQNDENCFHYGDLNGRRRGPPIEIAVNGIGEIEEIERPDIIFGSVSCGEDEILAGPGDGEFLVNGLIAIGYATFRMDKLDPSITFTDEDLTGYGYWYLMTTDGSREVYFGNDEPQLPLFAAAVEGGVVANGEIPGGGEATSPLITASGAVSFTLEQETFDEQSEEFGFEECSYEGQMSPDKYFMSGNYTCPSGNDGVWTGEMGYF